MEFDYLLKNGLTINCTWTSDSGCQNLISAVKFSSNSSYNLEDIVQVESCVHLCCSGPNTVPCKITVKLDKKSPWVITRVDVVSEARVIECYGSCEEYINTIHGEYMDDFEGCTVYSVSSMLPASQDIMLRFARMKHENKMWLYGLLFTVEKTAVPQLKVAGINLSNVNEILKDSGRPISEKAENCKKLLQQCCNSIDSSGSIDPHVLLKMFEGEYLNPLGETSKSMSKCLMRLIPFIMNKTEGGSVGASVEQMVLSPDSVETVSNSVIPSSNNNNNNIHVMNNGNIEDYIKTMKDYVDKRVNDMEEMLTNKLEQRLKDIEIAQSSKLDAIMKLIEKK